VSVLPTPRTLPIEAARIYVHRLKLLPIPVYGALLDGSCRCGKPDCTRSAGKHPIGAKWQERAPQTLGAVNAVFRNHVGNVGLYLGRSRIVVVDPDGELGLRTLNEFEDTGIVPQTLRSRTGSGGAHLFFRLAEHHDPAAISDRRFAPGLDVKKHGQVLEAPSRHACGGYYEWIDVVPMATLPDALYEKLRTPVVVAAAVASHTRDFRSMGDVYTRAVAYVAKMPVAVSGQGGHDATFRVARVLRGFANAGLPESAALSIFREFSQRCDPPWSERELAHKWKQTGRASRVPDFTARRAG